MSAPTRPEKITWSQPHPDALIKWEQSTNQAYVLDSQLLGGKVKGLCWPLPDLTLTQPLELVRKRSWLSDWSRVWELAREIA